VHATADGEIVVIHDATLERTTDGAGPVRTLTFAQVRRLDAGFRFTPDAGRTFPFRGRGLTVPSLTELQRALPGMPLNIEIKQAEPSIVAEVVALVRRGGAPVVLAAESHQVMEEIRRLAPDLPTSLSAEEVARFHAAVESGETPSLPAGAVALQIPPRFGSVTLVSEASLRAAHALGAEIHVWTINDPGEARRLLALGCDGIMSDFPGRVRPLLGAG
jgi:glycerophosphoryl diester phosphodiesterase